MGAGQLVVGDVKRLEVAQAAQSEDLFLPDLQAYRDADLEVDNGGTGGR